MTPEALEALMKLMSTYMIDYIKVGEVEMKKSLHSYPEKLQSTKSDFAQLFDNEEDVDLL